MGYRPGEATTDIESFGARMSERFKEFCLEYGRDLKLIFEPGKFLVSEAGAFIAKVNSTKRPHLPSLHRSTVASTTSRAQ